MKYTLILELADEVRIYCDRSNWILDVGDINNREYYSCLDDLCEGLLESRLTKELSKKEKSSVSSIIKTIRNVRKAVRDDLEQLDNFMIQADVARERGVW